MAKFERTVLSQQVADAIVRSISRSKDGDLMPSLRSIALRLGVSVPSVSGAFAILEEDGVLEACGERRRWRIRSAPGKGGGRKANPRPRNPAGKGGKLLYLTSQTMKEWISQHVAVYADLVTVLSAEGWELCHRVTGFQDAKAPHRSWDELVERERPDAIVVLSGNPVVASWALGTGIRTLFLGGVCDPHPLPIVKIGMSGPAQELVRRLVELGHRHVVLPLCGRSAGFARTIRDSIQTVQSVPGVEVHVLETPYATAPVLYDALKNHWRQHRPDALMLLDWREFVTAASFFCDADVLIPRDVSVALLSHDNSMDWHLPSLAHYEFGTMKLAKAVARWIVNEAGHASPDMRITLRALWRDGASLIDRR